MASNKKWFKRAIRSLSSGNDQIWELIKKKLSTSQIAQIEKKFNIVPSSSISVGSSSSQKISVMEDLHTEDETSSGTEAPTQDVNLNAAIKKVKAATKKIKPITTKAKPKKATRRKEK